MSRRSIGWAAVGAALLAGGAWWLSAPPITAPPLPEAPIEAPWVPPIQPSPPLVVAPPPAAVTPDAGVLAEVVIELVQNGQQLVGTRVELEGPGGRVSRPTDVMGFARFTLPTGAWRVVKPRLPERPVPYDGGSQRDWELAREQTTTTPFEVIAPLTQVRHELPSTWRYRLRVVDGKDSPVSGATVSWNGHVKSTDVLGEASLEVTEPTLQVQASRGTSRSIMRTASPGQVTTLVLEQWTHLEVNVKGAGKGTPFIRVMRRDEVVAAGFFGEPVQVPAGVLSVLARRNVQGRVHSARARVEARAGLMNAVDLDLAPAPPITGKLVDGQGRAVPGVGLHLREVAVTELLELAQARPSADLTALATELNLRADGGLARLPASTRTDLGGEFTWTPELTRNIDPVFQVVVVEGWRTKQESVLVKLDDEPLLIEADRTP